MTQGPDALAAPSPSRRALCPACQRPLASCLCRWAAPTDHQVEVLILQHPLEVNQAKGSARLLQLSLARCRLFVGETFDPVSLEAWLRPPGSSRRPVLLYPDTDAQADPGLRSAPAACPDELQDPARLRLVVLDGTWRKSRKMLYLNALLQQLPRLALHDPPPSHYRAVRRARRPDQLSTLEATVLALQQLESTTARGDPQRWQALLEAFDGFVEDRLVRAASSSAPPCR